MPDAKPIGIARTHHGGAGNGSVVADGHPRAIGRDYPYLFRPINPVAADCCRFSQPYRVVLALVSPKATLAATIDGVQQRSARALKEFPDRDLSDSEIRELEDNKTIGPDDYLSVPEMCWHITHHFAELEGKQLLNTGDVIVDARQDLDFTLDRNGVQLASTAAEAVRQGIPRRLLCTHPFLLYLTRRGSDTPFFAMWVDNAELLGRR